MKNWQWSLLLFAIMFTIMRTTDMPFIVFLFVFAPLFLIIMTYASFMYSFRDSIALERVPAKGCESRVASLEKEADDVRTLGFTKTDAFYIKSIPDSITYVLKHESLPVYMHLYNFGSKKAHIFMTFFEGGVELTTGASVSGGMIPRPDKKLTQVFEGLPYDRLFDEHLKGVSFIKGKGRKEWNAPYDFIKKEFRKRYLEVGEHVRSFSFWPVRLVVWTITQRGKVHRRSIEEQHKMGMVKCL